MIPRNDWKHKGAPGHFCCAKDCIFRLHTQVGPYKISTVGAMYRGEDTTMSNIGLDSHYETMVFLEGYWCEIDRVFLEGYWCEIDAERLTHNEGDDPYETDKLAEKMHEDMCLKWANKEDEK